YLVHADAQKANVFDYLLASKDIQLEMEAALTEHLKRIQAYLAPGANYHKIHYTPAEEQKFKECIASVVIPVFNRKEFIGTAIDSVLAQTVQNVEVIIVVNGGPDDPTIDGVRPYLPGGSKYDPRKPAVKLIIEDINNIGYCLNKGLREARGKYYVQLDSDDRLKPNAIEKIIEVFNSDDRIGMVIGSYEVWEKNETTGQINRKEDVAVVTHAEWTEENGRNNLLRINGAGAPRSAHIKLIRELGWFGMNDGEQSRNYGEDYDLVLRMSEQYRIGRVWEPIYDVIRHAGGTDHSIDQITIDRNDNAKDFMRKEAIRRRQQINQQR
ncbi:MAG: glycosyltransferase family 2 protein, partial [candidate division KSB1 bacterium]|nr:glycosyltransferase family 2 protein [candidate division KSB1 bacterium]